MTEDKIIDEALRYYAEARHSFAYKITQPGANIRGRRPSVREQHNAVALSKMVDDLIKRRAKATTQVLIDESAPGIAK